MPTVKDNLVRLAGSRIFSGFDMQGAFHVIEIAPQDREKTAFATPFGSFQQKRMGFGVTNGPATYCRLVERVLRDIPDSVAIGFLDDGVIHSYGLKQHIKNIRVTLTAYQKAGLRLSPRKCTFFAKEIIYLGHILDQHGIRPTDTYIEAVSKWKLPRYKTDARAFLGVTGYYRNHIPDYAKIAKPWTDVIGKTDQDAEKTPLVVTPAMEGSFEVLKHRLVTAPVLGFPYFKGDKAGQFILDTDYSKEQIAGVLSQQQGEHEVVIAYGSKKLSKSQQNWPSTKGELYAGMYWMQNYQYYLQYGPKFLWRTDNAALRYIRTMDCPSGIITRWLSTLADFEFEVQHRAGIKHTNVDGLSRSGHPEPADDHQPSCASLPEAEPAPLFQQRCLLQHTKDEFRILQAEDEDLALARQWVHEKQPPNSLEIRALSRVGKIYAGLFYGLSLDKANVLRYSVPNTDLLQGKQVVCLPKVLWDDTIRLGHATGGHMAQLITLERLKRTVFFPGMAAEIQDFINNCKSCQTKQHQIKDQRHTLVSPLEGYPFQKISLDYVGPLSEGRRTNSKWILTCRDTFSKWVEAFPMQRATALETVRILEREIFSRYGLPEEIHTDCAQSFKSGLFKAVGNLLGINLTDTSGYNAKSNAQIERMHRDLGSILRALIEDDPESWEDALPRALFAIRTNTCRSTGLAPFQILFGRDVSQPLDLIFGNPNGHEDLTGKADHHEYVRNLRKRIDRTQMYVRENLRDAVRRQRRQYHSEIKTFVAGAKVWLFTPVTKPGAPRKLSSFWTGPWIVCNKPVNAVMVRITPDPSWSTIKGSKVVSVDRLKPYKSKESNPASPEDDLLMEGDEFAEHVWTAAPRIPARQAPDPLPDAGDGLPPAPPDPPPRPPSPGLPMQVDDPPAPRGAARTPRRTPARPGTPFWTPGGTPGRTPGTPGDRILQNEKRYHPYEAETQAVRRNLNEEEPSEPPLPQVDPLVSPHAQRPQRVRRPPVRYTDQTAATRDAADAKAKALAKKRLEIMYNVNYV